MNRPTNNPDCPKVKYRVENLSPNWKRGPVSLSKACASWSRVKRFGRATGGNKPQQIASRRLTSAQAQEMLENLNLNWIHALASQTNGHFSDPIFVKDGQGRYLYANPARARVLGRKTADDLLGLTDDDLLPAEQAAKIRELEQPVLTTGEIAENQEEVLGELEAGDQAGEDDKLAGRCFLTSRTPLRNPTDQVVGLLGLSKEITDLKRMQVQLQQDRVEAEAANRAKSLFLANMSHELRTPLNAIIGITGLLLESPLNNEQEEFLNIVQTSGDTLVTLINDILDLNKIEAGKLELENVPLDLRSVIEDSLDLVAARASEKRLDLAYIIEDGTPSTVLGDPTRLSQILANLLSNAVKFTETGEVVVSVSAQESAGSSGSYELRFAVRDTGIGIEQDRIDHLFQPFTQLGAATTRLYGGTGLGLAISKRLSELMGGRIWVESRPQQGSTFYFSIHASPSPSQIKVYLQSSQPQLRGKHVLIVDDNDTNRRILKKQTESWGMKAQTSRSGAQALACLANGARFDLAILDMKMPVMDGVMLAQEVRKLSPVRHLPLILLSSMGSVGPQTEEGLPDLFQATVTKPIKPSQLYNVLMETLNAQPTAPYRVPAGQMVETTLGQRRPLRILLAEDNTINQKVALHMLQHLGYQADLAGDGAQVLKALEQKRYDVIFMDVQMPVLDGLETSRMILERMADTQRPRIIAMTANATESDRQACLDAGMDDYISKPFQLDRLATALKLSPANTLSLPESVRRPAKEAVAGPKIPHHRTRSRHNGNHASRDEIQRPVDLEAFRRLYDFIGDDPETLGELIISFITDSSQLVKNMVNALPNEDTHTLTRTAHTLKSGSAMFGALTMSILCQDVENLGSNGLLSEAAQKVALLEAEFNRVRAYFEHRHLHQTH